MSKIIIKNKKWIIRLIPFLLFFIFLVACKFTFKNDDEARAELNKVSSVNAGEEVTFNLTVVTENIDEYDNERFIIAVYAPKTWDHAKNTKVTFTCEKVWGSEVKNMSLIPDGTSPKNQNGLTWDQALRKETKDDPNIEGADMQWVAFISDDGAAVSNGFNPEIKVQVTMKTGPLNMRCKLGFFVNNNNDGLGSDDQYYGWIYTDCFEVVNGEGDIVDYCELHYNTAIPGSSTQNDILTFKFNGGIDDDPHKLNDLVNETEIYYNATAYTTDGLTYTKKVRMTKENEFGKTHALTFWAESFFEIDRSKTLQKIEYYFSNKDGSKFVDLYDDKKKEADKAGRIGPLGIEGDRPVEPFVYTFSCR